MLADTEYKDGGSGRSVSFTDMLLRVRGTSSKEDPSQLLVGVLEVKGHWQFKLPEGMTLQQGLEDDAQSANVIQVVQQVSSDWLLGSAGAQRLATAGSKHVARVADAAGELLNLTCAIPLVAKKHSKKHPLPITPSLCCRHMATRCRMSALC